MRADMKLATGMAMALMSGMAKAEDKTAQTQSLSDVVSAQTSLASVGHRPVITDAGVYADSSMQKDITDNATIISVGDKLFVDVRNVSDPDSDDLNSDFICNVFAIESDNTETLLADAVSCSKNADGSIPVSIGDNISGKIIVVDVYAKSDLLSAQTKGYAPVPDKSLAYRVSSINNVVSNSASSIYRVAYMEVNGKKIEVDRREPDDLHDDVIELPSAFSGAKMKVVIEGGLPPYVIKGNGSSSSFFSVAESDSHSAEVTVKENFKNSPDGFLQLTSKDSRGYIVSFKVRIAEMFISRGYQRNWLDAKNDCESDGYSFPYIGQTGNNGDPGALGPGSLTHSTFFWGGYAKYSFPNAYEYHWTNTEIDSRMALSMKLHRPDSMDAGMEADKKSEKYVLCKKTF